MANEGKDLNIEKVGILQIPKKVESKLDKVLPEQAKDTIKRFRVYLHGITNKYDAELSFQKDWSNKFKENKTKVMQYWKKYRYLDEIKEVCKIAEDSKILDVGCGISSILHFVKGYRFGIDPLADQYRKLYEYPEGITIRKGFGENIPFKDNCFDIVFCSNVLDHVTDPERAIEEIRRVLISEGFFVLTVEVFEENIKRGLEHPHTLSKKDVRDFLRGRFKSIFERESPWIPLFRYVNGSRKSDTSEWILILKPVI